MKVIILKYLGCLLVVSIVLGNPIDMLNSAYAQGPGDTLAWSMEASKKTFYPGEPVLLILKIRNTGQQEEMIDFGADGIEAFSMELRDQSKKLVAKGDKIIINGISRVDRPVVASGQTREKPIVLNQWCSTLLAPGQYNVTCRVDYLLGSEMQRQSGTGLKIGPLHRVELKSDITLVKTDVSRFKKILRDLASRALETTTKGTTWISNHSSRSSILVRLGGQYSLSISRSISSHSKIV